MLYDDDLGEEVPIDQGMFILLPSRNLSIIDFGDLPKFRSVIREDNANLILRYPFC